LRRGAWIALPAYLIAFFAPGAPTARAESYTVSAPTDYYVTFTEPTLFIARTYMYGGSPDTHLWLYSSSGDLVAANDDYFGLHPDCSDELDQMVARHQCVIAYTAGHTHRHRVRKMRRSGVPSIEIGCVKDFPGTWAEYRVYEGGITQVVHRISSPEALSWSDRCRNLYRDFGVDYESYAMGTLADRCLNLPLR